MSDLELLTALFHDIDHFLDGLDRTGGVVSVVSRYEQVILRLLVPLQESWENTFVKTR